LDDKTLSLILIKKKIMKKILVVFAFSTFFVACKNKGGNGLATDKNLLLTDTALLKRSGLLTDTGTANAIVRQNMVGTTTTSSTTTTTTTTTTTGLPNNKAATTNRGGSKSAGTTKNTSPARTTTPGSTGGNGTTASAPVKQDKGWSDAAKGTAIGAGSGAILGAVVSKDKVKGAVIGGVVGAAGGYAIGRDRDRKSGRVARKQNQ